MNASHTVCAAAKKIGITGQDWIARRNSGEKWCTTCKTWLSVSIFNKDGSRKDGLSAKCTPCRKKLYKRDYVPSPRPSRLGIRYIEAREDDKKQARLRVNNLIRNGAIPSPNQLPCADCGQVWSVEKRRHEYDHHKGYAAKHHEDVEPVCSKCHGKREVKRGTYAK